MVSCKSCGPYSQKMTALVNHSQCRSKENLEFLKGMELTKKANCLPSWRQNKVRYLK